MNKEGEGEKENKVKLISDVDHYGDDDDDDGRRRRWRKTGIK